MIKWIIDFLVSYVKDLFGRIKIKELEKEVKDATKTADHDVEKATDYYHDFMSDYAAYKSDLKRRGHTPGLREGSDSAEEGNRQSKGGNKKTKELD